VVDVDVGLVLHPETKTVQDSNAATIPARVLMFPIIVDTFFSIS
jgi:hypothetical protein